MLELSLHLGVSYPSAWLMKHKLMEVMRLCEESRQLSGKVELALCRFVWNATFTSTASGGHPSPALPASGKGASRPLPSGLPARRALADNTLASVARRNVASKPSPSGALRAALTRPSAPGDPGG